MSALLKIKNDLELLNRARDYFGDIIERFTDWLTIEWRSYVEEYICDRLSLVLHCNILINQLPESKASCFIHDVRANKNHILFVIFKANTVKPHRLEYWNEKLVFVPDVKVISGPEWIIPSLVGFYCIQYKIMDVHSDLLLFQSAVKDSHKFFPCIANWEPCPFAWSSAAIDNRGVVQQI